MKSKNGFSLAEMLVFIAITMLIIAILRPPLKNARNSAKQMADLEKNYDSYFRNISHYSGKIKEKKLTDHGNIPYPVLTFVVIDPDTGNEYSFPVKPSVYAVNKVGDTYIAPAEYRANIKVIAPEIPKVDSSQRPVPVGISVDPEDPTTTETIQPVPSNLPNTSTAPTTGRIKIKTMEGNQPCFYLQDLSGKVFRATVSLEDYERYNEEDIYYSG